MATASDEFLTRFRNWLVVGGMMTRSACGRTTSRRILHSRQAERGRGFALALVDRQDAAANDLADERRRVGRQADEQRCELRRDGSPALKSEADESRVLDRDPGEASVPGQTWKEQTAEAEKDTGQGVQRIARSGQRLRQRIPEQQLQEERRVPHHLDVDPRDRGHDPDVRQACHAEHGSQRGGEHDAEQRDPKRVEKADERARGRRCRATRTRLVPRAISNPAARPRKPKPDAMPRARRLVAVWIAMAAAMTNDDGDDQDLPDDGARARIAPGESRSDRHRRRGFGRGDQRSGGTYITPPSFHRRLTPRSIPSGVMLRSKLSA